MSLYGRKDRGLWIGELINFEVLVDSACRDIRLEFLAEAFSLLFPVEDIFEECLNLKVKAGRNGFRREFRGYESLVNL